MTAESQPKWIYKDPYWQGVYPALCCPECGTVDVGVTGVTLVDGGIIVSMQCDNAHGWNLTIQSDGKYVGIYNEPAPYEYRDWIIGTECRG